MPVLREFSNNNSVLISIHLQLQLQFNLVNKIKRFHYFRYFFIPVGIVFVKTVLSAIILMPYNVIKFEKFEICTH